MPKEWKTPGGSAAAVCLDMLKQPHLLIAGSTGSGKSVLLNSLIYTALFQAPHRCNFILIDPKRVELSQYKRLPHTLIYCNELPDIITALNQVLNLMEYRFSYMEQHNLKEWDNDHTYGLEPFEIRTKSLDRTLVDKVFAVCDYVIGNRIERNSRHIYDLSRLLTRVSLDDKLRELIIEVRAERASHSLCYSAQEGVNISKILSNIIKSDVYKTDYETITRAMMYKYVPYSDSIAALEAIIASGVFEA